MTETRHGYLVLADISGYTGYLAQVELEHAQEILTDLLECIVEKFKTALTISKLEGDAVFANVDEADLPRPESLLELVETTYAEFCRHRDSSLRATTCTCRACQNMAALELKFFLHYGDYITQNISGIRELVGSDVNLIHRLAKNHVTEVTGWKAYVLCTQAALTFIGLQLEGLHEYTESYEHFNPVQTWTFDLLPRYKTLMEARRVIIAPDESDLTTIYEFDHSLSAIWNWVTDINCRNAAMGGMVYWKPLSRKSGRTGAGASNHCAHGKGTSIETILDWHPFEYTTVNSKNGAIVFRETLLFTRLGENRTRLEVRMQMQKPKPLFLARLMLKMEFQKGNPYIEWFKRIDQILSQQENKEQTDKIQPEI